jgi:hypothetical protein
MAVGNTFGATALSSYGGFWIAFGITLTPGGFDIAGAFSPDGSANGAATPAFNNAMGFFLMVGFTHE